ncbi:MAG: tetratricopeptide repeat protein [Pseudomonadota bacterium]
MRRGLFPLLLLLGASFSPEVWAGKKDKVEIKPSAEEIAIEVAPTEEEHAAAFADYQSEVTRGQTARAADALVALVHDPARDVFRSEAYALLGDLLVKSDLPYGALMAYTRSLEIDSQSAWSPKAIESAFNLADRVGDVSVLEPVFAQNVGGDVDKLTRSRMAYLAARENYRQGKLGLTLGLLKLVVKDSPVHADALMLEGVVLNQQGKPNEALKPLLEAYDVASRTGRGGRFQEALLLNIGRTFYAANNFPRAIEYFAKVSRDSDFWLEAQFERAWAHFRIDDMNGAIALMFTHGSPFFDDWYYPEGQLLRVYALFLLCKFPEASKQIDLFKAHYQPLYQGMKGATVGLGPEDAFALTEGYLATGTPGDMPPSVMRAWKGDARLEAAVGAVHHADDELTRMRNVSANPFVAEVSGWLRERRTAIVQQEGARVAERLAARTEALGEMLTNVEISKLDMLQFETRLYQQASATGKLAEAERKVIRKERIRKGWVWWPWEGEYWVDELGYYSVNAIPECPEGLRSSQE